MLKHVDVHIMALIILLTNKKYDHIKKISIAHKLNELWRLHNIYRLQMLCWTQVCICFCNCLMSHIPRPTHFFPPVAYNF